MSQAEESSPQDQQRRDSSGSSTVVISILTALVVIVIGLAAYATLTNSSGALKSFNFSETLSSSQPVAIVNGEEIPRSAYEDNLAQIRQSFEAQGADISGTSTQALIEDQVMQGLVNRELIKQAAAEEGISVSDSEVQSTYDQYVSQAGGEEQFQSQLESAGLTEKELRSQIREQLLVQKYVDSQASEGQLNVSDQEVQQLYTQVSGQATNTPPLTQIRPQLEQRITQQKRQQLISQIVDQLRNEATIEILKK